MTEYLLDTDISSYIMQRSHEAVLRRLKTVPIGAVAISVITKSELLYGVDVSPRRQQDSLALSEYLRHVEVLIFSTKLPCTMRAAFKASGAMIGANDLFIAPHARSLRLILVTNNTAEFCRVPDLKIENLAASRRRDDPCPYAGTDAQRAPHSRADGGRGDVDAQAFGSPRARVCTRRWRRAARTWAARGRRFGRTQGHPISEQGPSIPTPYEYYCRQ